MPFDGVIVHPELAKISEIFATLGQNGRWWTNKRWSDVHGRKCLGQAMLEVYGVCGLHDEEKMEALERIPLSKHILEAAFVVTGKKWECIPYLNDNVRNFKTIRKILDQALVDIDRGYSLPRPANRNWPIRKMKAFLKLLAYPIIWAIDTLDDFFKEITPYKN